MSVPGEFVQLCCALEHNINVPPRLRFCALSRVFCCTTPHNTKSINYHAFGRERSRATPAWHDVLPKLCAPVRFRVERAHKFGSYFLIAGWCGACCALPGECKLYFEQIGVKETTTHITCNGFEGKHRHPNAKENIDADAVFVRPWMRPKMQWAVDHAIGVCVHVKCTQTFSCLILGLRGKTYKKPIWLKKKKKILFYQRETERFSEM